VNTTPAELGPGTGQRSRSKGIHNAFCYGTYLGPAELARHMPRQVTARELARAFHQHCGQDRLQAADTDVINAFARLDITSLWGDGSTVGTDGSQVSTWENNLLAETSIRYGSVGKIAYRYISDTYIALFTRFIPCVFSSHPVGCLHMGLLRCAKPGQARSLIPVGQIARASSVKAVATRSVVGSSTPSS
jgi:hypothetical protein